MGHTWKKCLLLTTCIVLASSASIKRKSRGNTLSNACKDAKGLDCLNNSDKILSKREALITFENAATCNETRQDCIRTCRERLECVKDCPICPQVHTINGMRRVIVEGVNDSFVHDSAIKGTNVTTVIKLVNLVNNTNLIDIPTNVNLTNQNHIHVYQNDSSDDGGEFGLGYNRFGSCCIVVEPKSCIPTSQGQSCHHKRRKTCGQQCTSRIIHADSRHRCTSENSCSQRISYIPQPRKPRCVYIPTWPFVSCGGHHHQNCDGCYEHYGYGAHQYYGGRIPQRCYSCYDDSFNMGPLYRRGPFFRPSFYHQPPCYLTGTCHVPFCGMYGCFGHEFIDPAWGYMGETMEPQFSRPPLMHGPPQMHRSPQMHRPLQMHRPPQIHRPPQMLPPQMLPPQMLPPQMLPPQLGSSDIGETSPKFVEIEDNLPHLPHDFADWGVEVHKCRVVENNGTVNIKNCSDTEWERNPFAASPSTYPYQPLESYEDPESYDYGGEMDSDIRNNPPLDYDGFERTEWDNQITEPPRNLHRRHAKNQRKHKIIYEE